MFNSISGGDHAPLTQSDERIVLDAMNHVLYKTINFRGNTDSYYDRQNSFINKVLETHTGIPITLTIVYISVARRLGVQLYAVNFPGHFLCKWKEHPEFPPDQQWTFIDAFYKGSRMAKPELSLNRFTRFEGDWREHMSMAEPLHVMRRMSLNMVYVSENEAREGRGNMDFLCNTMELYIHLASGTGDDLEHRINLARIYWFRQMYLSRIVTILAPVLAAHESLDVEVYHETVNLSQSAEARREQIEEEEEDDEITITRRSETKENIEFAIGMVMKHRRYDYTCVIAGWDSQCKASRSWIMQMGVHNLPKKQYQPFYNVLVDDGSERYAAQENLELSPDPQMVTHPKVGKYFQEYCGQYYIPNAEKSHEYPEDFDTETNRPVVSLEVDL